MRLRQGLLDALFDFSFTEFVTTRLLKVVYGLSIAGWAIWALVVAAGSLAVFRYSVLKGLGGLFLAAGVFIAGTVGSRIACELTIVAFRIADHAAETAEQSAVIATNTRPVP